MRHLLLSVLLILLIATPVSAQVGVKGLVENKLDNAVDEHNEAINNAINGVDNTPQTPPVVQPGQLKTGWLTRKSPASYGTPKDIRLFFAYPADLDKSRPTAALLMVQDDFGVNNALQQRAQEFARRGYYIVAPDFYNGQTPADAAKAAQLAKSLSADMPLTALRTGLSLLDEETKNGVITANHVGVLGLYSGGGYALQLAADDARIRATILLVASPLITDVRKLAPIQGPILSIFAANDTNPSADEVSKYEQVLKSAGKFDNRIIRLDGVSHNFANPNAQPGDFNQQKSDEAWQSINTWLDQKLPPRKQN